MKDTDENENQVESLLHSIKLLLRGKKITYEKLSIELELTVGSVKRLMNGEIPLTVDRMMIICQVLSIDFYELASMHKYGNRDATPLLSDKQESTLANDENLFSLYYLIGMGFHINYIMENFNYTHVEIQKYLFELEKLQIIRMTSNNNYKFVSSNKSRWKKNGPLHSKYMIEMAQEFASDVYNLDSGLHYFFNMPLTNNSIEVAKNKLHEVFREIEILSEKDLAIYSSVNSSLNIFIGAHNWFPSFIQTRRRK